MAPAGDPIIFVNLLLCSGIVALGLLCYRWSGDLLPAFIAAAFALFGISHAATLLGFKVTLTTPLIIIRALAYILVLVALWQHLKKSLLQKETRQAWVDYFKSETGQHGKKNRSEYFPRPVFHPMSVLQGQQRFPGTRPARSLHFLHRIIPG